MYVIIVGCGELGARLAHQISADRHNVVVIDEKFASLKSLGAEFNGRTIVGDGLDINVLKEAGIEKADALFVLTGNEDLNLVIGQLAKKMFKVEKVVIQMFSFSKEEVFRKKELVIINRNHLFLEKFKEVLSE